MVRNLGKKFEEDFKNSVPKEYFIYRLRDGTANFSGDKNENVRFQASNIADFIVMTNKLLFLELKSYKGISIPISGIRKNQLEGLCKIDNPKVEGYFIFNFRSSEKVYAIEAKKIKEFIENTDRKSISVEWTRENGIEIHGEKKRTRFKYNLNDFFRR